MNGKDVHKNKSIVPVLIVALIMFLGYRFGYVYFNERIDELKLESEEYEVKIKEVEEKIRNKPMYLSETERAKTVIEDILNLYGPGVTPERSTLFIIELESYVGIMAVPSVSFGGSQVLYTTDAIVGIGEEPMVATSNMLSFTYKTTYKGLKDCIEYITNYPERMNIQSMTVGYDQETGNLSGSILMNHYAVYAAFNEYKAPEPGGLRIGKDNIFNNSNK